MKPVRLPCCMFLWTWRYTTFTSIPIVLVILILLINKNVALIYSATICEQQQKGLCIVREFPIMFLSLMFAAFHNQSPLLSMLW